MQNAPCRSLFSCSNLFPDPIWRDLFRSTGHRETRATHTVTGASDTAVDSFNEAFNRHDALAPLSTDDTVFEDTSPAPDGRRVEGKAAVVEF